MSGARIRDPLPRLPALLALATLALGGCDRVPRPSGDAEAHGAPARAEAAHGHEADPAGHVVISEVMADPSAVPDERGEWIEVANTGTEPVFLQGWTLRSGGDRDHVIARPLVLAPGGAVVLARDARPAANGGADAAYAYGPALSLGNASDWVALGTPSGETADSVAWSSPPRGASRALLRPAAPHADASGPAWETSTEPFGRGDRGTPGQAYFRPDDPANDSPAGGEATPSRSGSRDSATSASTAGNGGDRDTAKKRDRGGDDEPRGTRGETGAGSDDDGGGAGRAEARGEPVYRDHAAFGIPLDSTPDDEHLMRKRQYVLSYNPRLNVANWVSWNLNRTHFGSAPRSSTFLSDPNLPRRFTRVVSSDYAGSGYSRGHMVRSEERTASPAENAATFLLTNVLPQHQDLNAGPWLGFERYLQRQAQREDREIYVIAGGIFPPNPPTLNGRGKVAIPTHTWKIAVLLPFGDGPDDVVAARQLRVIAVRMPNEAGIATRPWRDYVTTVDALEEETGYDFLTALPEAIQAEVENAR